MFAIVFRRFSGTFSFFLRPFAPDVDGSGGVKDLGRCIDRRATCGGCPLTDGFSSSFGLRETGVGGGGVGEFDVVSTIFSSSPLAGASFFGARLLGPGKGSGTP